MNSTDRLNIIQEFREKSIEGRFLDLVPVSERFADEIVNLRNKPQIKYWFNQENNISLADQINWLSVYAEKKDDIYWCLLKKDGTFIGTIRLYNIDLEGKSCEEGSYIIDEQYANEAPYAIEAKMLALDAAFGKIEIESMINQNRLDNKTINNLDNQLGFQSGEIVRIRNVEYVHRVLYAKDYFNNRIKFASLVDYWSAR